jgi:hypothetical protein
MAKTQAVEKFRVEEVVGVEKLGVRLNELDAEGLTVRDIFQHPQMRDVSNMSWTTSPELHPVSEHPDA